MNILYNAGFSSYTRDERRGEHTKAYTYIHTHIHADQMRRRREI